MASSSVGFPCNAFQLGSQASNTVVPWCEGWCLRGKGLPRRSGAIGFSTDKSTATIVECAYLPGEDGW